MHKSTLHKLAQEHFAQTNCLHKGTCSSCLHMLLCASTFHKKASGLSKHLCANCLHKLAQEHFAQTNCLHEGTCSSSLHMLLCASTFHKQASGLTKHLCANCLHKLAQEHFAQPCTRALCTNLQFAQRHLLKLFVQTALCKHFCTNKLFAQAWGGEEKTTFLAILAPFKINVSHIAISPS